MRKDIQKNLSSINLDKYDVKITKHDNDCLTVTIHKKFILCDVCRSKKHFRTLALRQDSRVKFFMIGKKVCRTCLYDVDLILNNLKDSVTSPLKTGRW